eukprot:CAMPEP_0183746520 /NCGR_PEP_ID=MMETSP0737-20130205/66799_1 /TAXON_ID=385413 /ORGANISM="Thalassiosira miniscula, Strain CCMP1093" /LENGTH=332 /DNA_ID=CAMNT_0025982217 /DNA_START=100 /DNA_END=1098 /DNA_ORIENTATION=+
MWQTKRKVADASATNNEMKSEIPSSSAVRSRRKNSGDKSADVQLREFFNGLGASIENLIDATPLGVSTPEPWSPSTDKKKAMLSNPISVLNTVSKKIDTLSPTNFFGGAVDEWTMASSKILGRLREGLANAVLAEEAFGGKTADVPVMVNPAADPVVPSEAGCDAFVAVGADKWGNTSRAVRPMKEAASEAKAMRKVTMKKILGFIDNITLRANGIVVTSDDVSVECSLSSMVDSVCSPCSSVPGTVSCDEDDFEDCPSVVTEMAGDEMKLEDTAEEETEPVPAEVEAPKEGEEAVEDLVSDEDDFVMTEEPDSEEEDFVDVQAEYEIAYRP